PGQCWLERPGCEAPGRSPFSPPPGRVGGLGAGQYGEPHLGIWCAKALEGAAGDMEGDSITPARKKVKGGSAAASRWCRRGKGRPRTPTGRQATPAQCIFRRGKGAAVGRRGPARACPVLPAPGRRNALQGV